MSAWLAIDGNGDIFVYKVRPNFCNLDNIWLASDEEIIQFVGNIDQLHASERVFQLKGLVPWV